MRSNRATSCGVVLGLLSGICLTFGMLGSMWWFFDLFAHFRIQYAFVSFAGFTLAVVGRSRRVAAAMGALSCIALLPVLPVWLPTANEANGPQLTVLHFNVNTASGDIDEILRFVGASEADIVFLQEVGPAWLPKLKTAVPGYYARIVEAREDNFGIAMLERRPGRPVVVVRDARLLMFTNAAATLPSIAVDVAIDDHRVAILSTHAVPPINSRYTQIRDAQLDAAAKWAAVQPIPAVIIGDLNVTPWSHGFGILQEAIPALLDSSRGHGVQATWPSFVPFLAIPIDHCLHDSRLQVVKRELGPSLGSDHRSVIVTFAFQTQTTTQAE